MNKLLFNAINNRYKGNLFENTERYDDNKMPVKVGESGWEHSADNEKNFLLRLYTIEDAKLLKYTVCEIIDVCMSRGHMPVIEIDEYDIKVKLFTRHLNDVTDIDVRLSKEIDNIVNDVNFLMSKT
jgi:pterin-4a-carbinolamine dehydratase